MILHVLVRSQCQYIIVVVLCVECTVEADGVQGKCSVVYGEEVEDLDKFFLEKQDVFWFLEVSKVSLCCFLVMTCVSYSVKYIPVNLMFLYTSRLTILLSRKQKTFPIMLERSSQLLKYVGTIFFSFLHLKTTCVYHRGKARANQPLGKDLVKGRIRG